MVQPKFPNFRPCQFILDTDGFILGCPEDAGNRLQAPFASLAGRRLREVLLAIESDWERLLPADFSQWPASVFLPWGMQGKASAGLMVEMLAAEGVHSASVAPSLAPAAALDQAGLDELPRGEAVQEQLFLRLRTAESRLNNYLHNFPGIFFSQRPDLSFSYIGPGLADKLSMDVRPLLRNGSRFLDLVLPADRSAFLADLDRFSIRGDSFSVTYRVRHPTGGNIIYFLDVRTPRISPSGLLLGYEGVWLDITRQSIAEARLSRTAWKESLATITSGLIHDFSNVMAGIFSLSELYYSSLEADHAWKRGMQQIMESSRQARKLVRRIIDLNREVSAQPNYHNLESLLSEQLDLIRVILPKQTRLETELTGEELPVYLDDVSFRQMILNLAMNSRDAIENDGGITIRVRKVGAGETVFDGAYGGAVQVQREGALIEFSDDGCGIPPELLARIWDPFFTTKEASKGSGFGLYNARLFIAQVKGRIAVRSRVGEGTSFLIYIPLADFTEALALDEEERRIASGASRPLIALFSGIDPSNFDLVARIHEREWELISFTRPEALRRYLREAPRCPNLLLTLVLGADPVADELLQEMRDTHPSMRRAVMVIGRSAEELTSEALAEVELVLEDSDGPDETMRQLTALLDPMHNSQ